MQINFIKLFACILVIVNHTCSYIVSNFLWYRIEFVLCRIAVPLFIMCTGFLTIDKETELTYTLKKIFRIVLPLFFFSLLIYVLREKNFNIVYFARILENPVIEQYWYLYMMIGLYIMQPYLNKICDSLNLNDFIILITMTLILPALNLNLSSYFFLTNFTYIVGYYIVGAFLRKIVDLQMLDCKKISIFSLTIFIVSYIIGIFIYSDKNIAFYNCDGILVIIMAISFMFTFINCNFLKNENSLLNKISSATFGVYLLHPILQNKIYELSIIQKCINYNEIVGILFLQFILILICFAFIIVWKKLINLIFKVIN